jgi:hypothetical protein
MHGNYNLKSGKRNKIIGKSNSISLASGSINQSRFSTIAAKQSLIDRIIMIKSLKSKKN